jgi:hypothetical protein
VLERIVLIRFRVAGHGLGQVLGFQAPWAHRLRFMAPVACCFASKIIDREGRTPAPNQSAPMNETPHRAPKDPLEGKTLKAILTELYEHFGWEGLSRQLSINCFEENPSINSSLKFLRKTPWARTRLEKIYLSFLQGKLKKQEPTHGSESDSGDNDH